MGSTPRDPYPPGYPARYHRHMHHPLGVRPSLWLLLVVSAVWAAAVSLRDPEIPASASGAVQGFAACRPWRDPYVWVSPTLPRLQREQTRAHEMEHAKSMSTRPCWWYTLEQFVPSRQLAEEARAWCAGIAVAVRQGADLEIEMEAAIDDIMSGDRYRRAASLGESRVREAVGEACADAG